jgi:hypothetical protein
VNIQDKISIAPHMSGSEINCYTRYLMPASNVLEYGVGGSTLLAAEIGVRSLYSVDTDGKWLANVLGDARVAGMVASGRAKLVHIDLGAVRSWGKPDNFSRILQWPNYARRPWQDGFRPDLVLVDGRFRNSCILQTLRYGGPDVTIAVHDFWNRRFYHGILPFVTVIDRADTLAVFRSNGRLGLGSRLLELRHLYDRR